jgi:hypothetical protein
MITTWDRKLVRRIFGPKKEDRIWKIRTNKEVTELYNNPDIVAEIRSRRIAWLGHLIRMDQGQMVTQVFDGKPGGRWADRPRLRWLDGVGADLRTMGREIWRVTAKDRTEWAGIARAAKALQRAVKLESSNKYLTKINIPRCRNKNICSFMFHNLFVEHALMVKRTCNQI